MSNAPTMNLEAKPGDKVVFSFPENGYPAQQEHTSEYLTETCIYTIQSIEVGTWSSRVEFDEFPGKWFNTILFRDYIDGASLAENLMQFTYNVVTETWALQNKREPGDPIDYGFGDIGHSLRSFYVGHHGTNESEFGVTLKIRQLPSDTSRKSGDLMEKEFAELAHPVLQELNFHNKKSMEVLRNALDHAIEWFEQQEEDEDA